MAAMKIAVNARGGNAAPAIPFRHEMIPISPRNQSCAAASRLAPATRNSFYAPDVGSREPMGKEGIKED
jgi:hypothetical protein